MISLDDTKYIFTILKIAVMKKFLLFFFSMTYGLMLGAQTNVQLNIHHKMGDAPFAILTPAKNNIDHDFDFKRMQYYISEISLTHDGGQVTPIEDTWLLVDATESTVVDLGDYDMTQLEAIRFHIGVDSMHNHLDPASWPNDHPLAPKSPTMHWGWIAGYFFITLEGRGGPNYDQNIELHGLLDDNYHAIELPLSETAVDNQLVINVAADYTRALEDIEVNDGNILHGGVGSARHAIENFRDYVFSIGGPATVSTIELSELQSLELYPNPSTSRHSTVRINTTGQHVYDLNICDVLGQSIQSITQVQSNEAIALELPAQGVYMIQLVKAGQTVLTKRLVVQ